MSTETVGVGGLPPIGPAVLTMGVFDGLHAGHRAILEAARSEAVERGVRSVALVFDPHPEEVLRPGLVVPYLAPPAANLSRIRQLGLDWALAIRFDATLRSLSAEDFLAAFAPALDLCALVMSPESAFGRNRGGTVARMRELGLERGFDVVVVDPVVVDGEVVSSSRVREAIEAGDVATARRLGVAPYLEGTVVAGEGRGREIGFTSATIRFDYVPAMPRPGVYAGLASALSDGAMPLQPALVSIGVRPNDEDDGAIVVEAHLLDFDGDLSGRRIAVELVSRLRDALHFPTTRALLEQAQRDVVDARRALAAEPPSPA
ncbi:MAG: bifunctional riboflavin kinase/FAD synthetase [Chloroflexota bacterium]|nr:bifunctional riboflavin kinase/FAD synthetase [Chloroflexota bacterium]